MVDPTTEAVEGEDGYSGSESEEELSIPNPITMQDLSKPINTWDIRYPESERSVMRAFAARNNVDLEQYCFASQPLFLETDSCVLFRPYYMHMIYKKVM